MRSTAAMAFRSLRDIDQQGLNVRLWCFECARGQVLDGIIWMAFKERGWSDELPEAARRFRCSTCGSREHILVLPATREDDRPVTWSRLVESWFHGKRSERRRYFDR